MPHEHELRFRQAARANKDPRGTWEFLPGRLLPANAEAFNQEATEKNQQTPGPRTGWQCLGNGVDAEATGSLGRAPDGESRYFCLFSPCDPAGHTSSLLALASPSLQGDMGPAQQFLG